jgi:hypothetical protein
MCSLAVGCYAILMFFKFRIRVTLSCAKLVARFQFDIKQITLYNMETQCGNAVRSYRSHYERIINSAKRKFSYLPSEHICDFV